MLYKDFNTKVEDVDEKGVVTIYVSSFDNKDCDEDIIRRGAFTKTIVENFKRIKHLKNHDRWQGIGLPLEMLENEHGLLVRSALNMQKQVSKDVYSDYKFHAEHNRTLEHSIGYHIIKSHYDDGLKANILTELSLGEYSTLDFWGANDQTHTVDIKSYKDYKDQIQLLELMLQKGNFTEEKYKDIQVQLRLLRETIKGNEPGSSTRHDNDGESAVDFFKSKLTFL